MRAELLVDPQEGRKEVLKKILRLSLPVVLSNLLYVVETTFSIFLVSGISTTAVAGVGYAASMLWFVYSLMALAYTGTSVLVAQRVGAGKDPSPPLLWGLVISTLVAFPLTIWGAKWVSLLMKLLGASPQVAHVARIYLEPIFLLIAVGFATNTIYAAYNGYGDTKTPLRVALIMNIVNITFSYLLIYGKAGFPSLGVAGAGWGVAISELVGLAVYFFLYVRYRKPFPIRWCWDKSVLLSFLRIGFPTAVERAVSSFSFNAFVGMLAHLGDKVLAAHQIGLRVESLSFMLGFGFMVGTVTIAGQNWGARNYAGLHYAVSTTAHLTAGLMATAGLFLVIFSKMLAGFFTKDGEVLRLAVYYLTLVAFSQPQMAYASVYSGALKGMGKTHVPLWVNLSSFWLFRIIPSYLLLQKVPSPLVPWFFMSFETTARALIFYLSYRSIMRKYA